MAELYLTETEYAAYREAQAGAKESRSTGVCGFITARIAALTGGPDGAEPPHLLLRERQGELTLYTNYLMRSGTEPREFVNIRLSDELLTAACGECFEAAGRSVPVTAALSGSPVNVFPDEAPEKYAGAVALRVCAREGRLPLAAGSKYKTPEKNLAVRAFFISGVISGAAASRQGRKLKTALERLGRETLALAVAKAAGQYTPAELTALRAAGAILLAADH